MIRRFVCVVRKQSSYSKSLLMLLILRTLMTIISAAMGSVPWAVGFCGVV